MKSTSRSSSEVRRPAQIARFVYYRAWGRSQVDAQFGSYYSCQRSLAQSGRTCRSTWSRASVRWLAAFTNTSRFDSICSCPAKSSNESGRRAFRIPSLPESRIVPEGFRPLYGFFLRRTKIAFFSLRRSLYLSRLSMVQKKVGLKTKGFNRQFWQD